MLVRAKATGGRRRNRWVATAVAVGTLVAAVVVFWPALTQTRGDRFTAGDIGALTAYGDGKQLADLGYRPYGRVEGDAVWIDCTTPESDSMCFVQTRQGRNRFFFVDYDRNWRGVITHVRVERIMYIKGQVNVGPIEKLLSEATFCTVVPGSTVPQLLEGEYPDPKYCR